VSYGLAIFGAALLLKAPEAKEDANVRAAPALGILLQDRIFWALVLGMFCGTFAGLLVIGNLKPMALASGLSPVSATAAISAFALGNTGGRIAWGWVADRTGYGAIPLSLAFLAVAMAGLVPLSARAGYYAVLSALIGFGFGACFVVYASQTASRYGLDRVGSVYPLVFLAYGLAGIIGPWVGGVVYDTTTSHTPAVIASVAVVLAGLLASSWLLRSATRCTCAEIAVEKVMTTEKETAE
jgi:OFA family oxalate/formate antiporter-like MFS transporter